MADILIVEDDHEIADTLAEGLTGAGHVTRTARNGIEGLRSIADRVPEPRAGARLTSFERARAMYRAGTVDGTRQVAR